MAEYFAVMVVRRPTRTPSSSNSTEMEVRDTGATSTSVVASAPVSSCVSVSMSETSARKVRVAFSSGTETVVAATPSTTVARPTSASPWWKTTSTPSGKVLPSSAPTEARSSTGTRASAASSALAVPDRGTVAWTCSRGVGATVTEVVTS